MSSQTAKNWKNYLLVQFVLTLVGGLFARHPLTQAILSVLAVGGFVLSIVRIWPNPNGPSENMWEWNLLLPVGSALVPLLALLYLPIEEIGAKFMLVSFAAIVALLIGRFVAYALKRSD